MKDAAPRQTAIIELAEYASLSEQDSVFREYWFTLKRYRWIIFSCTAAMFVCVALYTFTRIPLYTAQATLLIERKPPQVLKIQDALSESIEYAEYFKTQYELLKSRTLAARVIRDLALESKLVFAGRRDASENVGFMGGMFKALGSWKAPLSRGPAVPEPSMAGAKPGVIDAYVSMIKIQPVRGTGLVQVAFETPDPVVSAQLANGHSASYIRYGLDLRSKTNDEALGFLEKKLVELKDRVEKSEAALNSYRRDKGIISLNEKENIVVDRLADLNRRLTDAEAERIALEAKVRTIRGGNYDILPGLVNDPVMQNLKNEIARFEAEQVQLAREFKPGYPPLDKVMAQLDNSRRRFRSEIQSQIKGIESAYAAARTKESEIRAAMQLQKSATLDLKDSAVQYAILAREVDTNKQLYDAVLQRMREMAVAAESQSSNIFIVDRAEVPRFASYPNKTRSFLLALLLGLALGVGLAFFVEHLNSTFRTAQELERYVGLPHLGIVPDFTKIDGNAQSCFPHSGLAKRLGNGHHRDLPAQAFAGETIIDQPPLSVIAEAYRRVRSTILLAKADRPPKTILLTSATRDEGKTTSLINTAVTFAQMGARVLVIDADLRRPRCHKILKIANELGLAECLAGQIEAEKVLKPTRVQNLTLITSGAIPPNPAELLGSRTMVEAIQRFRERFDFVFIDSSPVLPVSDAVLLATRVDGVLLIVDGQHTPRQLVKDARLRLEHPHIKMLGVLLNRVDVHEGSYGSYYGHYYSYYGTESREPA